MKCPKCGHHTWHVDRSIHEESNEHHKVSNAGALRSVRAFLILQGIPSAPWHYRRRKCRRCGYMKAFVELPLSIVTEQRQNTPNREVDDD